LGVSFVIVPVALAVVNVAGFDAFSRLKTSKKPSTRAVPRSRNVFVRRRSSDDCDAPRPQLIVSQGPSSLKIARLLASSPSYAYAVVGISVLEPFWFRSTPSVIATGSAERNR
jgi:hypothetical protein